MNNPTSKLKLKQGQTLLVSIKCEVVEDAPSLEKSSHFDEQSNYQNKQKEPATDPQRKLIRVLGQKLGYDRESVSKMLQTLTKREAMTLIQQWKEEEAKKGGNGSYERYGN